MEIDPQRSLQLMRPTEKKKCRGNRKLQHFKRKCRSRGMTEEQITTVIHNRNNNNNISSNDNNQIQKKQKKKNQFNKRKQSQRNHQEETTTIRSISQLSISQQQPVPKKVKSDKEENNMASDSHPSM